MAQRAEPLSPLSQPIEKDRNSNTPIPAPVAEVETVTESLQIVPIDRSAVETEPPVQRSMYSLGLAIEKARSWGERQVRQLRSARTEEPLKLIAVVAGASFVIGVLLQVWRSNNESR